jgi:HK97 gp10 family phage protein
MSVKVKFEGLDEVLEAIDSIDDINDLNKVMGKACALVERAAKQKAPKGRTGELRNSITSKVEKEGNEIVGTIFTPLHYAPYVEFGTGLFAESGGRKDVPWRYEDEQGEWHTTSGMRPHPYMRPALYESQDKIIRMLKEGIKNK